MRSFVNCLLSVSVNADGASYMCCVLLLAIPLSLCFVAMLVAPVATTIPQRKCSMRTHWSWLSEGNLAFWCNFNRKMQYLPHGHKLASSFIYWGPTLTDHYKKKTNWNFCQSDSRSAVARLPFEYWWTWTPRAKYPEGWKATGWGLLVSV